MRTVTSYPMSFLALITLAPLLFSAPAQTQVAVSSDVRTAVEGCLSQAVNARPTQIGKNRYSGTNQTALFIWCHSEQARALFNTIQPYSREQGPEKNDMNETALTRFFGEAQCVRRLSDSSGRAIDVYECFINLNVGGPVIAAM